MYLQYTLTSYSYSVRLFTHIRSVIVANLYFVSHEIKPRSRSHTLPRSRWGTDG